MDPTPVIAKYDVKYGTEALVVPNPIQVPVDLMGRLDMDIPKDQTISGSIYYTPAGAADTSTVVFLVISADSYPSDAKSSTKPGIWFNVEGAAAKTPPPASPPGGATPPAHGTNAPGGTDAGGTAAEEGMTQAAYRSATQAAQTAPRQPSTPGAASPPKTTSPTPATTSTPSLPYALEYPLILLGNGAVLPLNGDPNTFTFQNRSKGTVRVSVRVGRQSNPS